MSARGGRSGAAGGPRGRAPRRAAAWLAAALLAAGCHFQAGLRPRDAGGAEVARLGIEVFDNDSRLPNLERDLHAALSGAARRWVDARLVAPSAADVVVRGRIVEVRRVEGIRSRDNRPLESGAQVQVVAELFDPRRATVVRTADAQVRVGTTLDVAEAQVDARARAVAVAADRLVLLLLAGDEGRGEAPPDGSGAVPGPE